VGTGQRTAFSASLPLKLFFFLHDLQQLVNTKQKQRLELPEVSKVRNLFPAEMVSGNKTQNHGILGVGRDLCGSPCLTPLPKQGHLEQAAQDHI